MQCTPRAVGKARAVGTTEGYPSINLDSRLSAQVPESAGKCIPSTPARMDACSCVSVCAAKGQQLPLTGSAAALALREAGRQLAAGIVIQCY